MGGQGSRSWFRSTTSCVGGAIAELQPGKSDDGRKDVCRWKEDVWMCVDGRKSCGRECVQVFELQRVTRVG